MTSEKPFLPSRTKDAFTEEGDFLMPLCLPSPGLLMGEDIAVIVLATNEGQRVGVPLGLQAVFDLHEVLGEALRMMQGQEGRSVQ